MNKIDIAVVGAGPAGLAALKCLREEGFNAVAFERRRCVGGLWSFSGNTAVTSALDDTVCNISKFVSGFSDFPMPRECPTHPGSSYIAKYFDLYASHFDLHEHIRFNTSVVKVIRNASDTAWDVHIRCEDEESVLAFDKVVFGHGSESVPRWPLVPGREKFKGTVIHGQAYKGPEPFKRKRVLVVGIGNTACEVSLGLSKIAKVYQSYRRGRIVLSRFRHGIAFDTLFAWPDLRLKYLLDSAVPWIMGPLGDRFLIKVMIEAAVESEPAEPGISHAEKLKRAERRLREDWRLLPCASMSITNPVVQEDFIPALRREEITPVPGFRGFVGENEVELTDGRVLEVDAVIFCTGYELDLGIIPELEMDGACGLPTLTTEDGLKERTEVDGQRGGSSQQPKLPRLFQMIFPPRRASSIAILSWLVPQENRWGVYELASMAIAQTWAAETAKSSKLEKRVDSSTTPALLPSLGDMNAQVDGYHKWFRSEWAKDRSISEGFVRGHAFYRFLHGAAGTGLYEKLDHVLSGRGWRLWWEDRALWAHLAQGPLNSYSWRLFETNPDGIPGCGRKAWPGARRALHESHEECANYQREVREKFQKK